MADMAQTPRITLKSIDFDHLEDVEDNPEAVLFRVALSETPSDIWILEMEQAYRAMPYQIKPPMQVIGDQLEIIFLPRYASELPSYFRFLGLMATRANDEARLTEQIHAASSADRHKAEFRDALRRIELPK
jgi:hypothetical protein